MTMVRVKGRIGVQMIRIAKRFFPKNRYTATRMSMLMMMTMARTMRRNNLKMNIVAEEKEPRMHEDTEIEMTVVVMTVKIIVTARHQVVVVAAAAVAAGVATMFSMTGTAVDRAMI